MTHIIDSETLSGLIATGQRALNGDSNDAEHDALYEIVMILETIQSEAGEKSKQLSAEEP
jgi:hypothetical protein